MLSTAKHNKGYFTKQKNEGVNAAMELPTHIGWPSPNELKSILKSGKIKNNKVTVKDISRAKYIHVKLVGL